LFNGIGIEIATAQTMRSMLITRGGRIIWRLKHVRHNIREIEIVDSCMVRRHGASPAIQPSRTLSSNSRRIARSASLSS
jgi:hypothetical protein